MTTVKDFIYSGSGRSWETKREPDLSRCAFEVAEPGRITNWHQCTRKPVENVEGYDFCKLHAGIVRQKLGLEQETFIRYAASFEHGKPFLGELDVVRETDHVIDIKKVRPLINENYGSLYAGSSRKDGTWMRKYKFFDTREEAMDWLRREARENLVYFSRKLEEAKEISKDLQR